MKGSAKNIQSVSEVVSEYYEVVGRREETSEGKEAIGVVVVSPRDVVSAQISSSSSNSSSNAVTSIFDKEPYKEFAEKKL